MPTASASPPNMFASWPNGKGTLLLGVRAVVAQSFERIHRSNLVGMGVMPLQFLLGVRAQTLHLVGNERFDIMVGNGELKPQQDVGLRIFRADGSVDEVSVLLRIDPRFSISPHLQWKPLAQLVDCYGYQGIFLGGR